jgi:hypothetical protein
MSLPMSWATFWTAWESWVAAVRPAKNMDGTDRIVGSKYQIYRSQRCTPGMQQRASKVGKLILTSLVMGAVQAAGVLGCVDKHWRHDVAFLGMSWAFLGLRNDAMTGWRAHGTGRSYLPQALGSMDMGYTGLCTCIGMCRFTVWLPRFITLKEAVWLQPNQGRNTPNWSRWWCIYQQAPCALFEIPLSAKLCIFPSHP